MAIIDLQNLHDLIGGLLGGATLHTRVVFAVNSNTAALGRKDVYASTGAGEVRLLQLSSVTIASSTDSDLWVFVVKDETGAANTNNLVIAPEGSETIDGAATVSITEDFGSITLYSDGSNLFSVT